MGTDWTAPDGCWRESSGVNGGWMGGGRERGMGGDKDADLDSTRPPATALHPPTPCMHIAIPVHGHREGELNRASLSQS